MNNQQKLQKAFEYGMANRPSVGGFPFLAECLRLSGVRRNSWSLPSAQSVYVMDGESVVSQGMPLLTGMANIPPFNERALIEVLRTDQAGKSTFPEFLMAAWKAGVIAYDVDFEKRTVIYRGAAGESYEEAYPPTEVHGLVF